MKKVYSSDVVSYPENVSIRVKSRVVTVEGPRGRLTKSFKHLACDITGYPAKREVKVEIWFGLSKHTACVGTVVTHIKNMIVGVTKGYLFKMKFVYAHFPVNVNATHENKCLEIRNFLGEKIVRKVNMLGDVQVERTDQKDEIKIYGNDLEHVSQSAAQIQQSTLVKNKDIRKFLDGIYVSEKTHILEEE
mmetsp:Transcript_74964/g.139885  ORF Transcript_74964/g.139885 Transcript_74964/m.139885 type:complete len:190 (+) Transcript_74964:59-628(+)